MTRVNNISDTEFNNVGNGSTKIYILKRNVADLLGNIVECVFEILAYHFCSGHHFINLTLQNWLNCRNP